MSLDMQNLAELLAIIATMGTDISEWYDEKLDRDAIAVDAAKLEGKSLEELRGLMGEDITAAVTLLKQIYEGRTDNPHQVTKEQVGLGLLENFGVASTEQSVEATVDNAYLTPAGLGAFWADKVGAAPETLDTLHELAAAFQNNPNIMTLLQERLDEHAAAISALQEAHVQQAALIAGNTAGLDELMEQMDNALRTLRPVR